MKSRIDKAREGYRDNNIHISKQAHSADSIMKAKEEHRGMGEYLGDFVFGAIDGSITTFAVVSGVAGAGLSNSVLLILGFANLFADGFSMAIGNYLSSKSDIEFAERERKREKWEIKNFPDGEREEIKEIYKRKGLTGEALENIVRAVTSNEDLWLDTMMSEELGILPEQKNPSKAGLITFVSFITIGFIPLMSYVASYFIDALRSIEYALSIILTGIAFFMIGTIKVYITGKQWWISGTETLLMGSAAALIAYAVGYLLKGLA